MKVFGLYVHSENQYFTTDPLNSCWPIVKITRRAFVNLSTLSSLSIRLGSGGRIEFLLQNPDARSCPRSVRHHCLSSDDQSRLDTLQLDSMQVSNLIAFSTWLLSQLLLCLQPLILMFSHVSMNHDFIVSDGYSNCPVSSCSAIHGSIHHDIFPTGSCYLVLVSFHLICVTLIMFI